MVISNFYFNFLDFKKIFNMGMKRFTENVNCYGCLGHSEYGYLPFDHIERIRVFIRLKMSTYTIALEISIG